jgi:catechol 2,3-dioxygenase-like lactoylglutathione lyase family enzyme
MLHLANPAIELAIITRRPEEMLRFYRDVLGFRYQMRLDFPSPTGNPDLGVPPGFQHRLEAGGMLIKLIHCPGADIPQTGEERAYARTGMRFLTLVVENLAQALEACRSGGGRVVHPLSLYDADVYYAFVADPDGNEIELAGVMPRGC